MPPGSYLPGPMPPSRSSHPHALHDDQEEELWSRRQMQTHNDVSAAIERAKSKRQDEVTAACALLTVAVCILCSSFLLRSIYHQISTIACGACTCIIVCVRMSMYVHVCMYVHIYARMYTVYAGTYVRMYAHMYIHVHTVSMYIYVHIICRLNMYVCVHIRTSVSTRMYVL